jgi:four helix bundle protein
MLIFDLEEINMKPQELEDRLINFAVMVIGVVEVLPNSKAGNHIAGQLVRSGTSPAPNYGEARSAESRKDFIHKMKISLKELRESVIWLKIVLRKNLVDERLVTKAIAECGELIAIFVSSTRTADGESISSKIKNQHSEIINRQ